MIKRLLFVGAVLASTGAGAQTTVPNGGMENWVTQMGVEDPAGWMTLNFMSAFGAPLTVEKTTDAHSGTYAAKLVTVESDFMGQMDTIPASLTLGTVDFASGEGTSGAPLVAAPDSLVGWFKFLPADNGSTDDDEFGLSITLSRWDAVNEVREIIAYGDYISNGAMASYTRVAIPIEYYLEVIPDTMEITMANAVVFRTPGTALFVDDLTLIYESTASVDPVTMLSPIRCYPNPAGAALSVVSPANVTLEVYNALGKHIETVSLTAEVPFTLSTAGYKNGVYFLKDTKGASQRFVVQH